MSCRSLLPFVVIALLSAFPATAGVLKVLVNAAPEGITHSDQSTNALSVSTNVTGRYGMGHATAQYGSLMAECATDTPIISPAGSDELVTAQVESLQNYTFDTPGLPVGTTLFAVFHVSLFGDVRGTNTGGGDYRTTFSFRVDGGNNSVLAANQTTQQGTSGPTLEQLTNLTLNAPFNVGQAGPLFVSSSLGLSTQSDGTNLEATPPGYGKATGSVTLAISLFDVIDSNSNHVDCTGQAESGYFAIKAYPAGAPFAPFTVSNAAPDSPGTTVGIIGGTASTNRTVDVSFETPPPLPPGLPACGTFSDVAKTDPWGWAIQGLACQGIMTGYTNGTFKPLANVTRGELATAVAVAFDFNDPVTGQTFEDVPPGSPFYEVAERLAIRGLILGYSCGVSANEPCLSPGNRPYFRPSGSVTRGEGAKVLALVSGYNDTPTGQSFTDVFTNNPFYLYIEQLNAHSVMRGYSDSTFRPLNTLTRGQLALSLARILKLPQPLASDPVDLEGTATDVIVVQMSYDPATAIAFYDSQGGLRLSWLDPAVGQWVNAVAGNTGGTPQFVLRAYDPIKDTQLGTFGLDLVNHVVWAVVNHNSQFAVTSISPGEKIVAATMSDPQTIHLECLGEPGAVNRIEASPDLNPAHFKTAASIIADRIGAFEFFDRIGSGNKFYRIVHP